MERQGERQSRQSDSSHGRMWSVLGMARSLLWLECMGNERGCKTNLERKVADTF